MIFLASWRNGFNGHSSWLFSFLARFSWLSFLCSNFAPRCCSCSCISAPRLTEHCQSRLMWRGQVYPSDAHGPRCGCATLRLTTQFRRCDGRRRTSSVASRSTHCPFLVVLVCLFVCLIDCLLWPLWEPERSWQRRASVRRNGHREARLCCSLVDLLAAQFPTLGFLLPVGGQHFQTGAGELPAGWWPCCKYAPPFQRSKIKKIWKIIKKWLWS